jgi:murein DD-endopeptidase MepM/ murein hydrolase activator NlpD
VSTHRGHRHAVRVERANPDPAAAGGRRRSATRGSHGISRTSSMIAGLALLVGAAAAATVGQALSSGHHTTSAIQRVKGSYTLSTSEQALGQRDATRVDRSGVRPRLKGTEGAQIAQLKVNARTRLLQQAARLAQKYAHKLKAGQWTEPIVPGSYHLGTRYGVRGWMWADGWHTGVDLDAAYGTPTIAVTNAKVLKTGWAGSYGQQVVLGLPDGMQIWYNHLSAIDVVAGEDVAEGQLVGRVGETGNAFGYHLHFEIYLKGHYHYGDAIDPVPVMIAHGAPL